jgi:hypothetical protein
MSKLIALCVLIVLLLVVSGPASATTTAMPAAPLFKMACGPVIDMHMHGVGLLRSYHVVLDDDVTWKAYTCSVPRADYDDLLYSGTDYGYCCFGRRGKR